MEHLAATAVFYTLFSVAFWGGLRTGTGVIGRLEFFLGVQAITLIAWFVMADNATTAAAFDLAFVVDASVAVISGYLTGCLSGAFARKLNRRPRFAWTAMMPFALPVMALMPEIRGGAARV